MLSAPAHENQAAASSSVTEQAARTHWLFMSSNTSFKLKEPEAISRREFMALPKRLSAIADESIRLNAIFLGYRENTESSTGPYALISGTMTAMSVIFKPGSLSRLYRILSY